MQGSDRLAPRRRRGEGQAPTASPKAKESPAKAPQAKAKGEAGSQNGVPRLLKRYREDVVPALVKEFGYKNPMEVPRLVKVVLNMGLGEALENQQVVEKAQSDLTIITGQHPVVTKAKKSIATFKLRAGQSIGVMVTLRGHRMYEFYDRLVSAALPRIRDFRGVNRASFDGRGNFSMGLTEQTIFPEIEYGQVDKARGLQITFVTTARANEAAARLLELLGMPFSR